jgi:hypothetical protein
VTTHDITPTESGAQCSCGKEFNVWKNRQFGYRTDNDIARQVNLARANANRHMQAANNKNAKHQHTQGDSK